MPIQDCFLSVDACGFHFRGRLAPSSGTGAAYNLLRFCLALGGLRVPARSGRHGRGRPAQRERHRLGIAEADDQIGPSLAEGEVPSRSTLAAPALNGVDLAQPLHQFVGVPGRIESANP